MAHATDRKKGEPGHDSFSPSVFFEQNPDIVLPEMGVSRKAAVRKMNKNALKKTSTSKYMHYLFCDSKFYQYYTPGAYSSGNDALYGYFSRKFISEGEHFSHFVPFQLDSNTFTIPQP